MTATPLSTLARVAPDVGDRGAAIVEVIRPLRSRERTHLPAGPKSALADDRTDAVGRQKLLEFELSRNAYYEVQRQHGC